MKITLLSALISLVFLFQVRATHIVGGEIELQVVNNQLSVSHRLSLNLYFDDINGNAGAKDLFVRVGIFSKKDNILISFATLPIVTDSLIGFSNPDCAQNNSVRTRFLRYSALVYLDPNLYTDSQGYYIAWERCCRNNVITNIQNPESAGSVFYLSFPALRQNGNLFPNSSPSFKVLTGDYICRNRPFVFDFGATDADGDSLVYSLVTPYNGYSSTLNPRPDFPTGTSNYPLVRWQTGYSTSNVIPGPQPLKVNARNGQLSVTTDVLGLYVFCVLVEEYRKGVKIGEVRRDFQLKVIDCAINNPPQSYLKIKGESGFYDSSKTITLKANEQKCLNLLVTDIDPEQFLKLAIEPINFSGSYTISPTTLQTNSSKDTLRATLCFDECTASFDGKPLVFNVLASDDGCPQALVSTLKVNVIVEPEANNRPVISTDLKNLKAETVINQLLKFNLFGTDIDNDSIKIIARGRGFNLAQVGMSFGNVSGVGKITSPFSWTPVCTALRNEDYVVDFIVIDNRCGRNLRDSISVNLKTLPTDNQSPNVVTSLAKNQIELIIDGTAAQTVDFDVIAQDPDTNPLKLYAQAQGFDFKKLGAVWTDKNGVGKIINPFQWKIDCSLLNGKEQASYVVNFVTEDNSCNPNRFDTVAVTISLKSKAIAFDSFKPVNIFTPNGDGKNDYFAIEDLPENNCFEKFEYIQIFSRWGDKVYESTDRNFRWTGGENASAEYYYLLKFTNKEFKGWINLVR